MAVFFASLQRAFLVFALSMVPLIESKAAIPIGISIYHIDPWAACIAGFLGMTLAAAIVLAILGWITTKLSSISPKADRLITRVFETTHHKHSLKFERLGVLALFLYVALPIPFAGVWSGSLLAHLFGINYRSALIALSLGSLVASVLFTLGTVGVLGLSRL